MGHIGKFISFNSLYLAIQVEKKKKKKKKKKTKATAFVQMLQFGTKNWNFYIYFKFFISVLKISLYYIKFPH